MATTGRPLLRRLCWVAACLVVLAGLAWAFRVCVIGVLLPGLVKSQLASLLGGEVACAKTETEFGSRIAVSMEDMRVANGTNRGGVVLRGCDLLRIRFDPWRLLSCALRPSRVLSAIEKAWVTGPVVECDSGRWPTVEALLGSGWIEAQSWSSIVVGWEKGTALLFQRPGEVLELRGVEGNLDVRDLPSIRGSLKFNDPSGARVSMYCGLQLAIKSFRAGLEMDQLGLPEFSRAVASLGLKLPQGLTGKLKMSVDCEGGFLTVDEIANFSDLRVIFDFSGANAADIRRIISEMLRKDRRAKMQHLPPARPGGGMRLKVDWDPRAGSR